MSKRLISLRQRYQQVRNYANNNEIKKVDRAYIAKYLEDCRKQMESIQRNNNFDNLEELDFYQDKFTKLDLILNNATASRLSTKDYTNQVK